jgi:hypothetical protein
MEEDFVNYLLSDAPLAALVSTRIRWTEKSQGEINPYVILNVVSRIKTYTYQEPTTLTPSRIQIDCYALTFIAAKNIARAVTARLSGMKVTQGSTVFEGGFFEGERDDKENVNTPDKLFRTSLDFIIWHKGT